MYITLFSVLLTIFTIVALDEKVPFPNEKLPHSTEFFTQNAKTYNIRNKRQDGFALFDTLKNSSLLSNLINGNQVKLNVPPEIYSSNELSKFLSLNSITSLQAAYKDYINVLDPNATDNEENDSNETPSFQPLVSTSNGIVRGSYVQDDTSYYSFQGIPYAEKPARFQSPTSAKRWDGIKDTVKQKPNCIQYDEFLQIKGGSEDCLYLNINTPTLDYKNLPVIVWIHGGSFKFGTSSQLIYGPQRLIKKDVVVVHINYRLGAFGFLSTRTKHAPGNAGLKDVLLALRWVQNNIHMFGGDNYNICLYGVSTGAGMVEYLMLSPIAQGLFQKAILQSGSALSNKFFSDDPVQSAFKLGKYLGRPTISIDELMDTLREADAFDILDAVEKMDVDGSPNMNYFNFVPSVENVIADEELLLPDTPEALLKRGSYNQIPTLVGFNSDEGLLDFKHIKNVPKYLDSLNDIFEYLLPADLLKCVKDPQKKKDILERIKQFYFNGRRISSDTIRNYVDMIGDILFTYGVQKSVHIKSKHLDAPIYYYQFAYNGAIGLSKNYISYNITGVAHADDLPYVFKFAIVDPIFQYDDEVKAVSKTMVTLYTNFLKYGNPTPSATENLPVIWESINDKTLPYLRISNTLEMKENPNKERYKFWSELNELSH
ncbi:juvenile hormone esterase-like [Arctopsyche grandis]|uniref:juvenile hormone esterase-like n=1 Tax=Arctopsyche grandis TaxID=121162 RepID=UPI00406D8A95